MANLKMVHEVDTAGPISELCRANHIIFGFDGTQDILEIDIKHHLLVRNTVKFPPISVRCLHWEGRQQYFVTFLNKVDLFEGGTLS